MSRVYFGQRGKMLTNAGQAANEGQATVGVQGRCSFACSDEFEVCVAFGLNTYQSCRDRIDSNVGAPKLLRLCDQGWCAPPPPK